MIRLKNATVSLDKTDPAIWHAVSVAARVWEGWGVDVVLTAANETGHHTNPDPWKQFHRLPDGTCRAVDLRTWNLPVNGRKQAVDELRRLLGPAYDVLYEKPGQTGEHCHVEYDPK